MNLPPHTPSMERIDRSSFRLNEYRDRDEIVIGLVNNMPDGAFRATENQIRSLLFAAAPAGGNFRLRLYTLPQIARDTTIQSDIDERYDNADRIGEHHLDAIIVSGAEPTEAELHKEVYWRGLTALIDWAQTNTVSAVWSCLAAHAVAWHLDAIPRQLQAKKLSGIYRCEKSAKHPVLALLGESWAVPHSRRNSLSETSLEASGYEVVSRVQGGGPDMFVKDVGSLFVCLQGHPEYDRDTLLREYRRDVHRYSNGTFTSFPDFPEGYFDRRTERSLWKLKDLMAAGPHSEKPRFPDLFGLTDYSWRSSAVSLYQGWLEWLIAQKTAAHQPAHPHTAVLQADTARRQSCVPAVAAL